MIDASELFRILHVSRYDAALPDGKISWRDDRGALVACARCEVILSYSTLDDSVVYGADHVQLNAAGVPVLPLDSMPIDLHPSGPMSEANARCSAIALAVRRGGQFVYRCRFGTTSLYLAVFELEIFPRSDERSAEVEKDALARYVGFVLRTAAEALRQGRGEGATGAALLQLERVIAEYRDQFNFDDADRVRALLQRLRGGEGVANVADLESEAGRWPQSPMFAMPGDLDAISLDTE